MKQKARVRRLEIRHKDFDKNLKDHQRYVGMYHRPGSLNK